MATMAPLNEMEADEPEFKPMTAEEARQWSEKNPSVSPGAVVGVQALVGLVVALVAWGLTGRENVGWSAGYGALAVVIPAALFARDWPESGLWRIRRHAPWAPHSGSSSGKWSRLP